MVESLIFRLPGCVGLLGLPDGFPRQAHFSCKTKTFITGCLHWKIKWHYYGQIDSRIINTYASGYVEENVFGAKPETGPFPELLKSYCLLAL
jgi:hypothetical protein